MRRAARGADPLGARDVAETEVSIRRRSLGDGRSFRRGAIQFALVVTQETTERIGPGVAVCEEADGGEKVLVVVVVAAVSGDGQRPVGVAESIRTRACSPVSGRSQSKSARARLRRLAVWVVDEEVPEPLELVEDHEVGLQCLNAGRCEQAAELADQLSRRLV